MRLRNERRAPLYAIAFAFATVSLKAFSAQWSYEPRVSMNVEANTNTRLLVNNPVETLNTLLDLGVVLGMKTDRTDISVTPGGRIARYFGYHALDNEMASLGIKGEHRWERSAFDMDTRNRTPYHGKGADQCSGLFAFGKSELHLSAFR